MIFLAGCALVFGGVAAIVVSALFDLSERILKASGVAAIIGAMLWMLSIMLSTAPRIMETMP
jgi:predicted membrane metal-binding protein